MRLALIADLLRAQVNQEEPFDWLDFQTKQIEFLADVSEMYAQRIVVKGFDVNDHKYVESLLNRPEGWPDTYDHKVASLFDAIVTLNGLYSENPKLSAIHLCEHIADLVKGTKQVSQSVVNEVWLSAPTPNKKIDREPKEKRKLGRKTKEESEILKAQMQALLVEHPSFVDNPIMLAEASGSSESTARRFVSEWQEKMLGKKK